ncbi:AlpA family phage regulatory protein [Vibrio sp. RW]|nr:MULTISPECIES: AlpA family phage regulatory protein [Vibrio]MDA0144167.1 AlpA family phage regulatory protein [Vibrio sp. RW]
MSKRDGHFPESVSLRQISVGWLSSDISDRVQRRIEVRN